MEISSEYLINIVDRAVTEDVDSGDVTTMAMVIGKRRGQASVIAKQDGVISGLDVAALVFYRLDPDSELTTDLVEGSRIARGDTLIEIEGGLDALLTGERTALNFLMHLSGVATLTSHYAREVSHTKCKILDTRKTTPGIRLLEKRAVASGGGMNHRIGLFDMILIKNNHITAAGSLTEAIQEAIKFQSEAGRQDLKIEVETRSLEDVKQAVHLAIDRIMLDNFTVNDTTKAVEFIKEIKPELEIEASGNMRLNQVRAYAETGVDFISVGALTHSADWLDMSMSIRAS